MASLIWGPVASLSYRRSGLLVRGVLHHHLVQVHNLPLWAWKDLWRGIMRALKVSTLQQASTAVTTLVEPSTLGTYSCTPADDSDLANCHALEALENFRHSVRKWCGASECPGAFAETYAYATDASIPANALSTVIIPASEGVFI